MRFSKPFATALFSVAVLAMLVGLAVFTPLRATGRSMSLLPKGEDITLALSQPARQRPGATAAGSPSDYTFDFDDLTLAQQRDKPFGYGPYWDIDPNWDALAWDSEDITVKNGALAITATFTTGSYARLTGYVGIEYKPGMDIQNKDHRAIRAEVRFDPPPPEDAMRASVWVYDRRDGGPGCTGSGHRWYRSVSVPVGIADPDVLVFDLDEPEHHFVHTTRRSSCVHPSEITTDSLKNILKVGFEFRSNQAYTGTITLDNVTVGGGELPVENRNQGFVRREGTGLTLDDRPYRFAGNNVYYLFYKSHYMIDDVFKTMQRNGIQVVRTWGFSDGKAPYADDGDGIANGNEGCALQPEPGLYYEPTWINMDYVIQSAGEHGIRLIIPLVNHWSDRDVEGGRNSFGGMGQYLEWCGVARYDCFGRLTNKAAFYSDPCARQLYKDYIRYMLNRENTLTHVKYVDDPTILAWELANEPRCQSGDACPSADAVYNWASEMSAYMRGLMGGEGSRQLIALGDEGFLDEPGDPDAYRNGHFGVDWTRNLQHIDTLDFGTVHLYPDSWGKDLAWSKDWILDHIAIAWRTGKPVVFEEYGVCRDEGDNPFSRGDCENRFPRDLTYAEWAKHFEFGAAGDAVWTVAGRVNGNNEGHIRIDDNCYYPDYDGFTFWEPSRSMAYLRAHAERMSLSHRRRLPLVLGDRSFDPRIPTPTPTATPTPLPTPTARPKLLFRTRPDACYSVHGSVPPDCLIRSQDGQLYVQHVDPSRSEFGVFDAQTCDRLNTFSGHRNNVLKGMAFSPNGDQVATMYHYSHQCTQNSIWLIDDLRGTPTGRGLSFCEADGGHYRHYMVYLTADYLALSSSGSESDALVLGIEDGALCTLAEWRANRGACPATASLGL